MHVCVCVRVCVCVCVCVYVCVCMTYEVLSPAFMYPTGGEKHPTSHLEMPVYVCVCVCVRSCALQEARDIFQPTIGIKDQTEAIKAREEIAAGPLKDKLTKLSGILVSTATCVCVCVCVTSSQSFLGF